MAGTLPPDPRPWPVRRERALRDHTMRRTMGEVTRRLAWAKREVYRAYSSGEAARREALQAKRRTLAELPTLVQQARQALERRGAVVHMAETAQDAVRIVTGLLQATGVRTVIKSKSMLTEELALNAGLEAAGIRVLETDLGEYIIQLAHERPSHILVPAAHKTREQIRELFAADAARSGVTTPASSDIGALTAYARRRLRAEFLAADAGVTGGNFVVADAGAVVLVTNEGNADMVVSLPPLLVTVVGVEKIVATWEDLIQAITQPAMSGTGRRLSSYTTVVQGPRPDSGADGPERWHVVFVDNGRLALRESPYGEVLACIRCGACLNVCPVFRQIGGHAYGSVYPGPIGVVETPALTQWAQGSELPTVACTVCHACGEACPMAIDLPRMIVQLRHDKVTRRLTPRGIDWTVRLWARWWSTPSGYRRTVRWARRGQLLMRRGPELRWAPGWAGGWFRGRTMPPVARETFHEWWARQRRD